MSKIVFKPIIYLDNLIRSIIGYLNVEPKVELTHTYIKFRYNLCDIPGKLYHIPHSLYIKGELNNYIFSLKDYNISQDMDVMYEYKSVSSKELLPINKYIRYHDNYIHPYSDSKTDDKISKEFNILRRLKHENILPIIDIIYNDKVQPTLIFEESISLRDYNLYGKEIMSISQQILLGVRYLHSIGIVHRNLNLETIRVTNVIKIAGFRYYTESFNRDTDYVLSNLNLPYASPELLLGVSFNSYSIDIWAIGCILYELCTNKKLFEGRTNYEVLSSQFRLLGYPKESDMDYNIISNYETYKRATRYMKTMGISIMGKLGKRKLFDNIPDNNLRYIISLILNYDYKERISCNLILKYSCYGEVNTLDITDEEVYSHMEKYPWQNKITALKLLINHINIHSLDKLFKIYHIIDENIRYIKPEEREDTLVKKCINVYYPYLYKSLDVLDYEFNFVTFYDYFRLYLDKILVNYTFIILFRLISLCLTINDVCFILMPKEFFEFCITVTYKLYNIIYDHELYPRLSEEKINRYLKLYSSYNNTEHILQLISDDIRYLFKHTSLDISKIFYFMSTL